MAVRGKKEETDGKTTDKVNVAKKVTADKFKVLKIRKRCFKMTISSISPPPMQ